VQVLEAAGFAVRVPEMSLCCGRPLYDYGFLDLAKRQLSRILEALRPEIAAGVPIVVLEPSCAAVFRDELPNLFPHDEDARGLRRQTYLLGELLADRASDFPMPTLAGKALVHGHCHQKAVLGMDAELATLRRLGVEVELPDVGCCGMAGGFGFEAGEHYDVSIRTGERALLPQVRKASPETFIIADGFSCREQIAQTTPRRALHLADVIALALRQDQRRGSVVPAGRSGTLGQRTRSMRFVGAGGALLGAGVGWWLGRRGRS
jgi:Fe-S oxidoreductase